MKTNELLRRSGRSQYDDNGDDVVIPERELEHAREQRRLNTVETCVESKLSLKAASRSSVQEVLDDLSRELRQERDNPAINKKQARATYDPLALSYDEYLETALWRRIKRRVLERDSKRCIRCGGKANRVHHRSYDDAVMLGNDDTKLASICEGCHTVIHFDGGGRKRSAEETERILLEEVGSATFCAPIVDLRKRDIERPAEWKRMTAVERSGFHQDCFTGCASVRGTPGPHQPADCFISGMEWLITRLIRKLPSSASGVRRSATNSLRRGREDPHGGLSPCRYRANP